MPRENFIKTADVVRLTFRQRYHRLKQKRNAPDDLRQRSARIQFKN